MNLQTTVPLSSIYTREEDFSADLADNLDELRVGKFEDVETEANVGTRRADIVAVGEDGTLTIRNIGVWLHLLNQRCYVQLYFQGANGSERRDKVMTLFPESDYVHENKDSSKETKVQFPVLDKGRNDRDDWDEIREKLVAMGTDIYNKIDESDL